MSSSVHMMPRALFLAFCASTTLAAFLAGCATVPEARVSLASTPVTLTELRERAVMMGAGGEPRYTRDTVTLVGGPGALVIALEESDYRVNVDVMVEEGGNSGVFVRSANGIWFPDGVEVQIDARDPKNFTGSIYNRAQTAAAVPQPGVWFHVEIEARGSRIESYVDGVLAASVDDAPPSGPLFALQAHHPGSVVHFKALVVERLE
jgi:hypothetical protein